MDEDCPLCCEPLDAFDKNFQPCSCGYRICGFCWHKIRSESNGLCPACRRVFNDRPAEFKPVAQEALQKPKIEKKVKKTEQRYKDADSRKHLIGIRVVQRNLVYITGLSPRIADENLLKRPEFLGQFGKIHKIVITRGQYNGNPSDSAYVTFLTREAAANAIHALDGLELDGRHLMASYGTTKYCSYWLRGMVDPNTECLFLHDVADEADSFSKDDMMAGRAHMNPPVGSKAHRWKLATTPKSMLGRHSSYDESEYDVGEPEEEQIPQPKPPSNSVIIPSAASNNPAASALPANASWATKNARPATATPPPGSGPLPGMLQSKPPAPMPVPKKQKQEQPLLAAPDSQQLSQSQSPPNLPPSPETLHSPNINPLDRTGQPADSVAMATGAVPVYQPSPSRSPQIPASVTSPSNLPGSDAASQDTPNLKAALSPVHDNGFDMSTLSKELDSLMEQEDGLSDSGALGENVTRRSSALEAALADAGVLLDNVDVNTDWSALSDPIVDSIYPGQSTSRSKLMSVFDSVDSGIAMTPSDSGRSPASSSSAGPTLPSPSGTLGLPLQPPPGLGFAEVPRGGPGATLRTMGPGHGREWHDGLRAIFPDVGISYAGAGPYGDQRFGSSSASSGYWAGGLMSPNTSSMDPRRTPMDNAYRSPHMHMHQSFGPAGQYIQPPPGLSQSPSRPSQAPPGFGDRYHPPPQGRSQTMPPPGYGPGSGMYGHYSGGRAGMPDPGAYHNYPPANKSPRHSAHGSPAHGGRTQTDIAALQGAAMFLQQRSSRDSPQVPHRPPNQQPFSFAANQSIGHDIRLSTAMYMAQQQQQQQAPMQQSRTPFSANDGAFFHQPVNDVDSFFRGQQSQQGESEALQSRLLSIINVSP